MLSEKFIAILEKDFVASLKEAQGWLIHLDEDHSFMPNGHNGPHYALETPIRNTAHWIVAFLIAEHLGLWPEGKKIAEKMGNWLFDDNIHYRQGGFVFRQSARSDWCNGVIGYGWLLEALSRLARYHNSHQANVLIKEIIDNHKFNKRVGAWHRFDPFTNRFAVDFTFDHQAWFAAAVSDCGERDNVEKFLDKCLCGGVRLRKNGLINHLFFAANIKNYINRVQYRVNDVIHPGRSSIVEEGYQIYSIYPLARLKMVFPTHPFFKSDTIKYSLQYCTLGNILKIKDNRYGFAYNAPGFEIPMCIVAFGDEMPLSSEDVEKIYSVQCEMTRGEKSQLHVKNNPDPLTLSSRIYELAMFLEAIHGQKDKSGLS